MQNSYFPAWMGEFPRKNTLWPQSEIDELYYEFAAGYTICEIAAKHGRTCGSVTSKASRNIGILRKHFGEVGIRNDVSYGFLFPSNHRDNHCKCNCLSTRKVPGSAPIEYESISWTAVLALAAIVISISALIVSIVKYI